MANPSDHCDGDCNACSKEIFSICDDRQYDLGSDEMFGEIINDEGDEDDNDADDRNS